MTAEEFIENKYGHNSWKVYPPSKGAVIRWLEEYAKLKAGNTNKAKRLKVGDKVTRRGYTGEITKECNKDFHWVVKWDMIDSHTITHENNLIKK